MGKNLTCSTVFIETLDVSSFLSICSCVYKSAIHTIQYIFWASFVSYILLGQGILPTPLGTQWFGRLRSPWELSQGLIFLRVQQDEAVCCQRRHQQKGCLSSGACHDCGLNIHSWSHIPLAQALCQHLTLKLTWYLIISKPGGWGHDRSRFLSSAFKSINNVDLLASMIKNLFKKCPKGVVWPVRESNPEKWRWTKPE